MQHASQTTAEPTATTVETHAREGCSFWWAFFGALPAMVIAMVIRWRMNFTGVYPGGMDAGYYPLQARDLIERGHLSYIDLPLIFWIDAALARGIMLFTGQDMDSASLLATRIVDSLAEPLAAIPLAALVWMWSRGRKPWSVALCSGVVAVVATLTPSILHMTGDFQKQSLGLIWIAGAAWALNGALARGGKKWWLAASGMMTLAGLSHVGIIGAAMVMAACAIVAYGVTSGKWSVRRLGVGALALSVGLAAVWGVVRIVSPNKAAELLQAPNKLFGSGEETNGRGGPSGMQEGMSIGFIAVAVLATWATWRLWRDRQRVHPAAVGVVIGAAGTALFLSNPLINGEYAHRLALMTPIPAAIVLAFVLSRRAARGKFPWPALLLGGAATTVSAAGLGLVQLPVQGLTGGGPGGMGGPRLAPMARERGSRGGDDTNGDRRPTRRGPGMLAGGPSGPGGGFGGGGMRLVSDEAGPELRKIRDVLAEPRKTMILARHGLEWWAGYFTKAAVRPGQAPDWVFDKYEHVYVLVEKGGGGRGPRGGGMQADFRPVSDPLGDDAGGPPMDDDFGPPDGPPDGSRDFDGPGSRGGPPEGFGRGPRGFGGPRGGMGGGPGGGMGAPQVPEGSKVVFEGTYYTLYEIQRQPTSGTAPSGR